MGLVTRDEVIEAMAIEMIKKRPQKATKLALLLNILVFTPRLILDFPAGVITMFKNISINRNCPS
jgi:hypothetical protein